MVIELYPGNTVGFKVYVLIDGFVIFPIGFQGIKKFDSAKQFTAWMRLAPNNKISGGKVLIYLKGVAD